MVSPFSRQSMNKIPSAFQNTEAKTLPADVYVFGRFGRLLPAAVYSVVKWWIHVSSIVTYLRPNSFLLHWNSRKQRSESSTRRCFWSTLSKRGTHFEYSFFMDKCSCKMVNTLSSDIFNPSTISTSIYDRPKTSWAFSIICVCKTAFKSSIPPLNRCFRRSRVRITLIKPLLYLNSIFPIRKQCFINTRYSDFSIVLKICNNNFT